MGTAKAKFTVEDVLEEVVTESGVEGNEEDVPSLAEVLKSSVQEFYPLRSTVDSFTAFRDEAMQALEGVYRNHRVGLLDDSEKILDKPVNVRPAIAAEIMLWLKSIYRRMTGSPRAQNPWYIELRRGIPKEIFMVIIDACSKSPTNFGISVESSLLKFTHKKRLIRDLSKLAGVSATLVRDKLKKVFKGRREGCKAELVVSNEKPFVLTYDERNLKIVLKCHYGYWNELGYGFHG